jgi:hypothetical protein
VLDPRFNIPAEVLAGTKAEADAIRAKRARIRDIMVLSFTLTKRESDD